MSAPASTEPNDVGRSVRPTPFAVPVLPQHVTTIHRADDAADAAVLVLLVAAAGANPAAGNTDGDDSAASDREAAPVKILGDTDAAIAAFGIDMTRLTQVTPVRTKAGAVTTVAVGVQGQHQVPEPWQSIERVVFVGVGEQTGTHLHQAGAVAAQQVRGVSRAAIIGLETLGDAHLRRFMNAFHLGGYAAPTTKTTSAKDLPAQHLSVIGDVSDEVLRCAEIGAAATKRARYWAAMPSSVKTPAWLAEQAVEAMAGLADVTTEVFSADRLEQLGCGGLLTVGKGAEVPPCMVRIDYSPKGSASMPHVALIGKGVTFDTGGIDIKPADAMALMRTDMSGSAAVLAAMGEIAARKLPVRVTALLAIAENGFSWKAFKASDVITHFGGTTVEVGNTDAEGRLVMADALAYAALEIRPDVMLDLATLTGAATMAMGRTYAAVLSNSPTTVEALLAAADVVGEPLWEFPLVADYAQFLDSDVADLRNVPVSGDNPKGGAITAALFLERFVYDIPWAHLDIAAMARADADKPGTPKGATGFGAQLVTQFVSQLAAQHG